MQRSSSAAVPVEPNSMGALVLNSDWCVCRGVLCEACVSIHSKLLEPSWQADLRTWHGRCQRPWVSALSSKLVARIVPAACHPERSG